MRWGWLVRATPRRLLLPPCRRRHLLPTSTLAWHPLSCPAAVTPYASTASGQLEVQLRSASTDASFVTSQVSVGREDEGGS